MRMLVCSPLHGRPKSCMRLLLEASRATPQDLPPDMEFFQVPPAPAPPPQPRIPGLVYMPCAPWHSQCDAVLLGLTMVAYIRCLSVDWLWVGSALMHTCLSMCPNSTSCCPWQHLKSAVLLTAHGGAPSHATSFEFPSQAQT